MYSYFSFLLLAMLTRTLTLSAVRLDPIHNTILNALYRRTESWREVDELARDVFPGANAYKDAELRSFVMPRLRRLASLGVVKLGGNGAAISLEGIDFIEKARARLNPGG